MKLINFFYWLFICLLFYSCSFSKDGSEAIVSNRVRVTDKVYFDKSTNRYCFYEQNLTKSAQDEMEVISLNRENQIIDSLEKDAYYKQRLFKVITSNSFRDVEDTTFVSDDDSLAVTDSVPQVYSISASLGKNEFIRERLDILNSGALGVNGSCTYYQSGPINALFYAVYQNLVVEHENEIVLLTGIDTDIIDPYFYLGSVGSLTVAYSNSEFQANKHWSCSVEIWYQIYGYTYE